MKLFENIQQPHRGVVSFVLICGLVKLNFKLM